MQRPMGLMAPAWLLSGTLMKAGHSLLMDDVLEAVAIQVKGVLHARLHAAQF